MKTAPGRRRWCAWFAAGCLALPSAGAQTPAKWDGSASNGFIVSVLRHDDSIFASTDLGLYRAAWRDKVWHRLPLPDAALAGGELATEAAPSSVLVYYQRRLWIEPPKEGGTGLFVSRDLGQTWDRVAEGRDFASVFVQSGGDLYACERMKTPDPPPEPDKESSAWTFDAEGRKLYLWYRVLVSHDFGKNWLDLSEGISSACCYGIFRDLDHPELIRLVGAPEGDAKRLHHYEAEDRDYLWKEIPWQKWRDDLDRQEEYTFGLVEEGSNDSVARADLSSLLKYPFLQWGNFLDLHAIQIETEKPAYTFRQHEPMPVALRASFVFSREGLRFADHEDETVCWALRGIADKGYRFATSAKATAATGRGAEAAGYRDDPRTRIVALDDDHPYRRTVDLSKLYAFPEPGRYRVQLVKACCPFFKEDAGFTGQVIDVTITP